MSVLTADADSPCVEGECSSVMYRPWKPLLLALLEMQCLLDGLSVVFTFCALGTNRDGGCSQMIHTLEPESKQIGKITLK